MDWGRAGVCARRLRPAALVPADVHWRASPVGLLCGASVSGLAGIRPGSQLPLNTAIPVHHPFHLFEAVDFTCDDDEDDDNV